MNTYDAMFVVSKRIAITNHAKSLRIFSSLLKTNPNAVPAKIDKDANVRRKNASQGAFRRGVGLSCGSGVRKCMKNVDSV